MDHGLQQVGSLVGLDTPVLRVVHVDVATELGEICVSQGPTWTIKGIAVPVLVSVEPDLDVNLAAVQPLEGEAGHLLPHGEGLTGGLINIRPTDPARSGITQDPVCEVFGLPPAPLQ